MGASQQGESKMPLLYACQSYRDSIGFRVYVIGFVVMVTKWDYELEYN